MNISMYLWSFYVSLLLGKERVTNAFKVLKNITPLTDKMFFDSTQLKLTFTNNGTFSLK